LDATSAAYQLVGLESSGGGFLFDKSSGYFDRVAHSFDPMTPTTRFYLERQAKADEFDKFAFEDGALLSVAKLDSPKDVVRLEPGNTTVMTGSRYRLEYKYSDTEGVDSVVVKVNIERDTGALNSVTPILKLIRIQFAG
jgi:hypothetical protein